MRPSALLLVLAAVFLFYGTPSPAEAAGTLSTASIVAYTNDGRADYGAGRLAEDALLSAAAQKKANDMAARGYFSHIGPDGEAPWKWFRSVGYYYYNAGENLAVHFTDAASLTNAWMKSPTHKANIINPIYTKIGIGIARGYYQGYETTFIVQFFAKPALAYKPVKKRVSVSAPIATVSSRRY